MKAAIGKTNNDNNSTGGSTLQVQDLLALGTYMWAINILSLYYIFIGTPHIDDVELTLIKIIKIASAISGSSAGYIILFVSDFGPRDQDTATVGCAKVFLRTISSVILIASERRLGKERGQVMHLCEML
ncbi:hypothetical protein V865_002091 [Kwoniella europaea PYCC6329]|uniref:Uncharacterized protein n=1 Tax=Kwoniella europaea PYCC6329 TaxID=1423913 RepID=A0AAX4KF72_9TREE